MTSKPRIIVPNHFYHIHSVCSPELKIFKTNEMKLFFLEQLAITLKLYGFSCIAWSLLDDHYHLIVKSSTIQVSLFMQRFNSIIAKKYDKDNNRAGSVFAKRFSSIVIQNGTDLNDIIRHVHLNPVRKGICTLENLDNYQWTGHYFIVNNISSPTIELNLLLDRFGKDDPLSKYKNLIKTGTENQETIELVKKSNRGTLSFHESNCFIIGKDDFKELVLSEDTCRKARIARYKRENVTLDDLLEKVRGCIDIDREDFFRQGKMNEVSTARQLFAIIGHCYYEFKCVDIADYFKVTASAVSSMISNCKRISDIEYLKSIVLL